ncbi:MAG: hypothetical protein IJR49_03945 [Treponema sp.]|nr:hypothetical protein [Treponema sp.]
MKKFYIFILSFMFVFAPLFSIDFGGKVNSTTLLHGNTFKTLKWFESASIHGWLSSVFNEKYQLKLSSDISYEFRYNQDDGSIRNILDINLLKLSSQVTSGANRLETAIGRFAINDITNSIFNQVCDGANVHYSGQWLAINGYIGITRLLNMHDVVMLQETDDTTVPTDTAKAVYVIGPAYIPIGLTFAFPSLFLNQTLSAEAWAFIDASNSYNRFYATIALSGPFYKNIFYNASTTFGSENMQTLSNLTKFDFVYYPVPNARVGFNMFYASGNQKGVDKFRGFTSMTAILATDTVELTNEYDSKIKLGINASYTIASRVYIGADLGAVFTAPDKVSYNGFQWAFNVVWNIFHDLQLAAGMYQYISVVDLNNKTSFSLSGTFVF